MTLIIHVDGAAKGNPGPAGAGVLIEDETGKILDEISEFLGNTTNNAAEYQALCLALAVAQRKGGTSLQIFSDSELMVRQFNGSYKVRNPLLAQLWSKAKSLATRFDQVRLSHISRENNKKADRLANRAIAQKSLQVP